MNPETKAKFVLAMHKHSLQALDSGGSIASSAPFPVTNTAAPGVGAGGFTSAATSSNPGQAAGGAPAGQNFGQTLFGQANNVTAPNYGGTANANEQAIYNEQQQQQNTAANLAAEAAGQGPNPAQSQFQQNAAQIGQQQAATIASQKGINPALAIRSAAGQGAAASQAAAGTAATLGAEQQLSAQQQLAQQQATIAGESGNLYGTAVGGINAQNAANAQIAQSNAKNAQSGIGGIIGGIGSLLGLAEGGDVDAEELQYPMPMFADGGATPGPLSVLGAALSGAKPQSSTAPQDSSAPKSFAGKWLSAGSLKPFNQDQIQAQAAPAQNVFMNKGAPFSKGGNVKLAAKGGKVAAENKSQKATVRDNSRKNDKVPALLSEDEIVIPRSITTHPMAAQKAMQFVQATLNKRRMRAA